LLRNTLLFIVIIVAGLTSCTNHPSKNPKSASVSFDLDSIRKRGKLIAVTDFNSTNYFIYKGEPMGFNYELLKTFSDVIGIDLEIIPENHPEKAYRMLESGEADLLALSLFADSAVQEKIHYTTPISETRQVLVQRKPRNWRSLTTAALNKAIIRDQSGLAGKTIFVQAGSSYARNLISMSRENIDSMSIIEVPFEPEKLIQHVASGEIEYTVCDESLALVNSTYFPAIDISTTVSRNQSISWGVREKNSEDLLAEFNKWIVSFRKTGSYANLYAKYFKNSRSVSIIRSDLYALRSGKVSNYDDMIRKFSASIDWDWRLLASLICQESRFDPHVESYAGAFGLMQIMPDTGKNYGIDSTSTPEENVEAGIRYIRWLHSIFDPKIPDEKERINFILASYNAGPGHVLDAMKLAEKNGMDPHKWNGNVAVWLLKKSQPVYYNDAVVKNGYFRGVESVNFVSEILERFEHYKNIIPVEKSRPY
jgi:membrane-bound lytic murein transglycosylase F